MMIQSFNYEDDQFTSVLIYQYFSIKLKEPFFSLVSHHSFYILSPNQ